MIHIKRRSFIYLLLTTLFISLVATACIGSSNYKNLENKNRREKEANIVESSEDTSVPNEEDTSNTNIPIEEIKGFYREDKEMFNYAKKFIGKPAPNFKMKNLVSNKEKSLSEFRGKDIVIQFMGSWCTVCHKTSYYVDMINKKSDIDIISVAIDDNKEDVKEFIDDANISYTDVNIATNPKDINNIYELKLIPTFFYIDKKGRVQMVLSGRISEDIIKRYINKSFV